MRRLKNERGVVLTWLIQALLIVGIIGIVLFDAGSIAWNYFGVDSTADEIALEIAATAESSEVANLALLQEEARRLAREAGARLVGQVQVTTDSIEVKIRRAANTIVVGRVGAIADWARATATGSAPTS